MTSHLPAEDIGSSKRMKNNCIFCQIIEGQAPSEIVFENERVIVFKDHLPRSPIHLLVCPKTHYSDFLNTPPEEVTYLFKVCHALADKLKVESGFRLMINNGALAGQIVFHLHIHFISRVKELGAEKLDLVIK